MALTVLLADTTRSPGAARLAVGLARAGLVVSVVCPPRGHPVFMIRTSDRIFPYSGLRPLASLVAAIKGSQPQVIIPCDDRAVQHLHELYVRTQGAGKTEVDIAALIERSLGLPENYPLVLSRHAFLEIARDQGLRVPETRLVGTAGDLHDWNSNHGFPCVLKADGTSGGIGVKVAHTPDQAALSLSQLTQFYGAGRAVKRWIVNQDAFWVRPWWNRAQPPVIVQRYIPGRPANCAVICWKGKVLAGVAVEAVSTQGPTGPATVVRVVDSPQMMLAAEKVAGRLGLSGFFGLDFVIETGSNALYLIEINPRVTPPCHLQLGKGRDMIAALHAQLTGKPLHEAPPVTRNEMIAYFPGAWHAKSEAIESSFQDVPHDEPELVQELLQPWPNRTIVGRVFDWAYLHCSRSPGLDTGAPHWTAADAGESAVLDHPER